MKDFYGESKFYNKALRRIDKLDIPMREKLDIKWLLADISCEAIIFGMHKARGEAT